MLFDLTKFLFDLSTYSVFALCIMYLGIQFTSLTETWSKKVQAINVFTVSPPINTSSHTICWQSSCLYWPWIMYRWRLKIKILLWYIHTFGSNCWHRTHFENVQTSDPNLLGKSQQSNKRDQTKLFLKCTRQNCWVYVKQCC